MTRIRGKWTAEELEEMRRADEEIEREFRWTNEELAAQRERDRQIQRESLPPEKRHLAEYHRAYYEANRDSIAEYRRAYQEANRDSIAEYQRAYREANRDSIAEKRRAYYEANRDSIAEKRRAYYEANKDSIAEKQRWIADERKVRGYTQRNLAEFTGCSQPLIALLESGNMSLEKCARRDVICRFLKGVGYEELMAQGL